VAGPVRAVLLDLDDTLVDTRGAFRVAILEVLTRWIPALDEQGREAAVLHWATDPKGYFRAFTRGELDMAAQRRARVVDLHAEFGGPVLGPAGFTEWARAYEQALNRSWALAPDAEELLDTLTALGVPVGAVTNANRHYQQAKLTLLGLADRVPLVACVDDLGFGKPRREVFWLACTRLGVPPAETGYVGDELDVDARGARDAGLRGIWLARRPSGPVPTDVPVARSLGEVPALLGLAPVGDQGTDLGPGQAAR
jgi:putative hydrolase of the HAD superfamily